MLDDDDGARHRIAGRVAHRAADDAGGGAGLGGEFRRVEADENEQDDGGRGRRPPSDRREAKRVHYGRKHGCVTPR